MKRLGMSVGLFLLMLSAALGQGWTFGGAGTWFAHDVAGGWDETIGRPALYASDTDTIWASYEGNTVVSNANKRVVRVTTYSNSGASSGTWTPNVLAGSNSTLAANDGHGSPTMARNASGTGKGCVFISYGSHITDLQLAATTTPDDPSAWTSSSLAQATYGPFTFPRPFVSSGSLNILFATSGAGIGQEEAFGLVSGTINSNCTVSWGGSTKKLIDVATAGNDGWILPGTSNQVGSKVSVVFSYGTFIGHYPLSNIYYASYDFSTGAISNYDGTTVIASASLPVTKAQLDANFIVYSSTQLNSCKPDMVVDDAGATHIVDCEGDGSTFEQYFHIVSAGAGQAWSAKHVIYSFPSPAAQSTPANILIAKAANGGVAAYWPDYSCATCTVYAAGAGNMMVSPRSSAGSWGSNTLLLGATQYGFLDPAKIDNGPSWARLMWHEAFGDGTTNAGNARGIIYGDVGPLRRAGSF